MMEMTTTEHISLITPDRLDNLRRAVLMTRDASGDMAELGVYKGGSARVIAEACPEKTLYLFDTFSGLPYDETHERDPGGYCKAGMFACSLKEAEKNLAGYRAVFHVGDFVEVVTQIVGHTYSFVHVDCDLFRPALAAIMYFWPRMPDGGIMYFDDYGCDFTGVTEAVDGYFAPEQIVKQHDTHGYQIGAYVVK